MHKCIHWQLICSCFISTFKGGKLADQLNNLGRIVTVQNGTIVGFWNLGQIVAWDELSPNLL